MAQARDVFEVTLDQLNSIQNRWRPKLTRELLCKPPFGLVLDVIKCLVERYKWFPDDLSAFELNLARYEVHSPCRRFE